jgi:hypothetical protein
MNRIEAVRANLANLKETSAMGCYASSIAAALTASGRLTTAGQVERTAKRPARQLPSGHQANRMFEFLLSRSKRVTLWYGPQAEALARRYYDGEPLARSDYMAMVAARFGQTIAGYCGDKNEADFTANRNEAMGIMAKHRSKWGFSFDRITVDGLTKQLASGPVMIETDNVRTTHALTLLEVNQDGAGTVTLFDSNPKCRSAIRTEALTPLLRDRAPETPLLVVQ